MFGRARNRENPSKRLNLLGLLRSEIAPNRTRTCNRPLRRRMLYPIELWALQHPYDTSVPPALATTSKDHCGGAICVSQRKDQSVHDKAASGDGKSAGLVRRMRQVEEAPTAGMCGRLFLPGQRAWRRAKKGNGDESHDSVAVPEAQSAPRASGTVAWSKLRITHRLHDSGSEGVTPRVRDAAADRGGSGRGVIGPGTGAEDQESDDGEHRFLHSGPHCVFCGLNVAQNRS